MAAVAFRPMPATAKAHRVRLVLTDDSAVVRAGLRALLAAEAQIEIVGEADCVAAAITLCAQT
jgi:DNA-binding NarL/FixJ family response regulator